MPPKTRSQNKERGTLVALVTLRVKAFIDEDGQVRRFPDGTSLSDDEDTHSKAAPVPKKSTTHKPKMASKGKRRGPAEQQVGPGAGPVELTVHSKSQKPCIKPGTSSVADDETPAGDEVNIESLFSLVSAPPTKVDAKLDREELARFREGRHADIVIRFSARPCKRHTWKAHRYILTRSRLLGRLLNTREDLVAQEFVSIGNSATFRLSVSHANNFPELKFTYCDDIDRDTDSVFLVDALLVFIYAKGLQPSVADRLGDSFTSLVRLAVLAVEFELPGLSELALGMLRHLCVRTAREQLTSSPDGEVVDFCRAVRCAYSSANTDAPILVATQVLLAEFTLAWRGALTKSKDLDALMDEVSDFPELIRELSIGFGESKLNLFANEQM